MNILFISEILPVNTQASSVVFHRHLIDLEKRGHKICILTDRNSLSREKKELPENWKILTLPNRSILLPPYKPYGILQEYRFAFYYYRYVLPFIKENKIDKLVGYLNGQFLAPLTSYIKKKTGLPLVTFYHDDNLELNFSEHKKTFTSLKKNTEELITVSDKVLVASEAFSQNWPQHSNKFELLYPLPDSSNPVYDNKNKSYHLGYSGTVYNELMQPLSKIAAALKNKGKLFIISNRNINVSGDHVINLPLFPTTEESNRYLVDNCNAIIIPYPEEIRDMRWIQTCFPSKFIQACQLEIPIIVIAPANSAIGKWCRENNWILYTERYDDDSINLLLEYIHRRDVIEQTINAKKTYFNIDEIKNQFASNF